MAISQFRGTLRRAREVLENMRKNRGRSGDRRSQLDPKEKQALKLAEIREALVAAGYDTTAKQAGVLGLGRSTAWMVLNLGQSHQTYSSIAASSQEGPPKSRTVCRGQDPRPVWA